MQVIGSLLFSLIQLIAMGRPDFGSLVLVIQSKMKIPQMDSLEHLN